MCDDYRYRCNVVDSPHVQPNSNFAAKRERETLMRGCTVGPLFLKYPVAYKIFAVFCTCAVFFRSAS